MTANSIDEHATLANSNGFRTFQVFTAQTSFMLVIANKPDTLYKRAAKRLSCREDQVRFYDYNMKRVEKQELEDTIFNSCVPPIQPPLTLHAFIAGKQVFLDPEENDGLTRERSLTGVVIGDELDYAWFAEEYQLLDYIAKRLHCNSRSEYLLFDANLKLLKIKSKTRPAESYCKTPYVIAYRIAK